VFEYRILPSGQLKQYVLEPRHVAQVDEHETHSPSESDVVVCPLGQDAIHADETKTEPLGHFVHLSVSTAH
jgi:hypothetical protein